MNYVTAIRAVFINRTNEKIRAKGVDMNTYEAMVRIQASNMVVRTQVQAQSNQDALWLLEGQYGSGNVVTLPTLVSS